MAIVNELLRSNEEVRAAYAALIKRGESDEGARTAIGKAILRCLEEELQGGIDKFSEVISTISLARKDHAQCPQRPEAKHFPAIVPEYSARCERAGHPLKGCDPDRLTKITFLYEPGTPGTPMKLDDKVRSTEPATASAVLDLYDRYGSFIGR